MHIWKWSAAALAGVCLMAAPVAYADVTIQIDPEAIYPFHQGIFEGWGTSLCWWANRIGYSDKLSSLAAEAFCDKESGLGLNILRYNIGGGDNPLHNHITRTDSMMPGFWVNPSYDASHGMYTWEYDWSQDANQRNVLKHCLEAGGEGMLVEGFSNSPPYFMTVSGCSSGARVASENNLRDDAYDAFAQYLADVAAHFAEEWGIRFQSMAPMNEPDTSFWQAHSPKQEGCHFDPGESQSKILVALSQKLKEKGLDNIQLSGTDETAVDTQARALAKLSEEALAAISRVDTHTYNPSGRSMLRRQTLARNKNLWMSEVDGGEILGNNAGEMGAGLWLANRIIEDLNGLRPSAWILWQVIDSHICKDGYLGRRDTGMVNTRGGYWGTAVMDHDREELRLTMKYYVFGQFTRYIRPGAQMLAVNGPAVAARDGNRLIVVIMNQAAQEMPAKIDLSRMQDAFPKGSRASAVRTSGSIADGEHWAKLPVLLTESDGLHMILAPHSVTTFIINGKAEN
ncbi:MAG: hypothetical protein J6A79_06715 [Clostridia bacterium]|nr:hypothetical protein [Clostridia bacterium]